MEILIQGARDLGLVLTATQIRRFGLYLERLRATAAGAVDGIKRLLDPHCRINPGALGLWPVTELGAPHEHP